jgi:DhnA family fructose-bisphosphate aldolase class Ia
VPPHVAFSTPTAAEHLKPIYSLPSSCAGINFVVRIPTKDGKAIKALPCGLAGIVTRAGKAARIGANVNTDIVKVPL